MESDGSSWVSRHARALAVALVIVAAFSVAAAVLEVSRQDAASSSQSQGCQTFSSLLGISAAYIAGEIPVQNYTVLIHETGGNPQTITICPWRPSG
jgi:hypothetical protein